MKINFKIKPVTFPLLLGVAKNVEISVITYDDHFGHILVSYEIYGGLPIEKILPNDKTKIILNSGLIDIPINDYNKNQDREEFITNFVANKIGVEIIQNNINDNVLPYIEIDNWFDDYFDMVYLINLDSRTDRLESMLDIFKKINLTKYRIITPIDATTIKRVKRMSPNNISCKLSHMSCIEDAISNNYNRIMIFEDDVCFNQSNPSIEKNIGYHLNECFNFMKNNERDMFYFDNIILTEKNIKF